MYAYREFKDNDKPKKTTPEMREHLSLLQSLTGQFSNKHPLPVDQMTIFRDVIYSIGNKLQEQLDTEIQIKAFVSTFLTNENLQNLWHLAVFCHWKSMIKYLTQHHSDIIDINSTHCGPKGTALIKAASEQDLSLVRFLIKHGASLDTPIDASQHQPLSTIAWALFSQKKPVEILEEIITTPKDSPWRNVLTDAYGFHYDHQLATVMGIADETFQPQYHKNLVELDGGYVSTGLQLFNDFFTPFLENLDESATIKEQLHRVQASVEAGRVGSSHVEKAAKNALNSKTNQGISFPVLFRDHLASISICGDYLLKFNKGGYRKGPPGIAFYRITNQDALLKTIKKNRYAFSREETFTPSYFNKEFDVEAELETIGHYTMPKQTSGNCFFESIKGMFLAGVIAQDLDSIKLTDESSPDILNAIIGKALALYIPFENYIIQETAKLHHHQINQLNDLLDVNYFNQSLLEKCQCAYPELKKWLITTESKTTHPKLT